MKLKKSIQSNHPGKVTKLKIELHSLWSKIRRFFVMPNFAVLVQNFEGLHYFQFASKMTRQEIFPYHLISRPGFEPMSVELHLLRGPFKDVLPTELQHRGMDLNWRPSYSNLQTTGFSHPHSRLLPFRDCKATSWKSPKLRLLFKARLAGQVSDPQNFSASSFTRSIGFLEGTISASAQPGDVLGN